MLQTFAGGVGAILSIAVVIVAIAVFIAELIVALDERDG